jgi:hypothetical protein
MTFILSPIWGLGYAGEISPYGNSICLNYNDFTHSTNYFFQDNKLRSDVFDISKTFIDYYQIQNRKDCIASCNLTVNLVTGQYLNSNFSNWTTGTVSGGKYYLTNSSNSDKLTGLYKFDPYKMNHTIYITDTKNQMYNYGILSHELAHYWFKRKCFNEGYYNEYYAIDFHNYFMGNYTFFIKNSLSNGD